MVLRIITPEPHAASGLFNRLLFGSLQRPVTEMSAGAPQFKRTGEDALAWLAPHEADPAHIAPSISM